MGCVHFHPIFVFVIEPSCGKITLFLVFDVCNQKFGPKYTVRMFNCLSTTYWAGQDIEIEIVCRNNRGMLQFILLCASHSKRGKYIVAGFHSTTGTTCKQCTNHSFRIKGFFFLPLTSTISYY